MSRPSGIVADTERLFVPGREECVLSVWHGDVCAKIVRVRRGESVLVGRGRHLVAERTGLDRHKLLIPATEPWISRRHLLVRNTGRGTRLAVLDGVQNPGRIRYWGELHWQRVTGGQAWEPRDGLIAALLVDRPDDWVLTLTADVDGEGRERSAAGPDGEITERAAAHTAIDVTPSQRDAIVAPLLDAVRWPPPAGPSRIRGWAELPTGDAHRMAYKRLTDVAGADPDFPWQDQGQRGVDPVLLQLLIESGSITYADVQRGHPWRPGAAEGLIPAHRAARPERGEPS